MSQQTAFFHAPTLLAKAGYLYPICVGDYICTEDYRVDRTSYDSYLLLYTRSGTGYVNIHGKPQPIKEGDLVLLDCYQPHTYGADGSWEMEWMHFDGVTARHYFQVIHNLYGTVIRLPLQDLDSVLLPFRKIMEAFLSRKPLKEVLISQYITDLLCQLIASSETAYTPSPNTSGEAMAYLNQHYQEALNIESLASYCGLSLSYFIRQFKRETGMSPYQYLTAIRISSAKFYLKTTPRTVKDIGFSCGFQSENSFCITFRKHTGLTPTQYRNGEEIPRDST